MMLPLPGQWLAVVEFLGEKTTSAVPCSWLEDGHRRCRWPTKVTDKKREDMVQRNAPPGPWKLYAVRVLGYADCYTEAQNKVDKSLETSALESELSESDYSDHPQGPPQSSNSRAPVSSSQPTVESRQTPASSLHGERSSDFVSRPPLSLPLPPATLPRAIQKTAELAPNDRHVPSVLSSGHMRNVYKALVELKEDLRNLRDVVLKIEATVQSTSPSESQSFVLPSLPLQSEDHLAELEAHLLDPHYRQQFVSFIARIGGEAVNDTVKLTLRRLLTNNIMTEYSLKGKQKKKAFDQLHIYGCIIDGIKDRFKDETEANINIKLGKHLAGATDREGGRAKRQKRVEGQENLPDDFPLTP